MIKKHVTLKKLTKAFDFQVIYPGLDNLKRKILFPTVHRVGAELTGHLAISDELNKQLHVLGTEEMRYIDSLEPETRKERLKRYFMYNFPAIVVACREEIHPDFIKYAKEYNKPLLTTEHKSAVIIRKLKYYLQGKLAPEIRIEDHVLVEIFGIGVLITGYKDACIGTTLELIERGHKYITDENLIIKKIGKNRLLGENGYDKSNVDTHFFLGTENLNIDITNNYGIIATRRTKEIDIYISLEKWETGKYYDRLGIDKNYENILGVEVSKLNLPVRKGRNLAVIIETAAMNERLKRSGVNSAEYFLGETAKKIRENKKKQVEGNMDKFGLKVSDLVEKFDLEILSGEKHIKDTYIKKTHLHNPALALSGFYEVFNTLGAKSIQLFSQGELDYLYSFPKEVMEENLKKFLSFDFPAMILAEPENIPVELLEGAKKEEKILLVAKKSSTQLTADLNQYLEKFFSAKVTMHGVFLELFGFGVLLMGKSGIGKSETALELIHRGHRLITDDKVTFHEDPNGMVVGKADEIPYFMELRGIGIIDIKALYGLGAVRNEKRLDAIIELKELKGDEYLTKNANSMDTQDVLGYDVDHTELYISSGRNAATMVETTIMNLIAKKYGYDSENIYKGKKRHQNYIGG